MKKKNKSAPKPYERELSPAGNYNWQMDLIKPNKNQPREYFDEEKMAGLRASIKAVGIQTPIKIRVLDEISGRAIIVDGERRYRIAQELKMLKIPAILDMSKADDIYLKSVVMNFCREDLSPVETAKALKKIMDKYDYNQTKLAEICGKTSGWVSNMLKNLRLDDSVVAEMKTGQISPVIATSVSRFPKDKQLLVARSLKKAEEKKGGALTVQEVSLATSKIAGELKIQTEQTKRSRPLRNFATGKVETMTRQLENMTKSLKEFLEIDEEELANVNGHNLSSLNSAFTVFDETFDLAKEKFKKAY